jgi:hypothetical protein
VNKRGWLKIEFLQHLEALLVVFDNGLVVFIFLEFCFKMFFILLLLDFPNDILQGGAFKNLLF